ncbi:MAG: HAMP domain-containing protein [Desulfamplus sp.]|nr:HAMP domain-containing protein [Desulfamplus sp.]
MIDVSCGSCGKKYRLDPAIIKSENARFTCKDCGSVNNLDQYIPKPSSLSPPEKQKEPTREMLQVTWLNRLQVKVNSVVVSLIIVIMSTFTVITYMTEEQKVESDLKTTSVNVAKRLSVYLVEAFWSLDDEILSESLKSEMIDRDIYAINLVDRSGKKIYLGYRRNAQWQLVPNDSQVTGEQFISANEIIMKDGKQIGSVGVFFTQEFVREQFVQSMYQILITSLLLLIAVALAVSVVLNRMILRPIARLTDAANRISVGNLDLEIPIESKDEIGVLAEAFARMKVSMAFAIKQLRKR